MRILGQLPWQVAYAWAHWHEKSSTLSPRRLSSAMVARWGAYALARPAQRKALCWAEELLIVQQTQLLMTVSPRWHSEVAHRSPTAKPVDWKGEVVVRAAVHPWTAHLLDHSPPTRQAPEPSRPRKTNTTSNTNFERPGGERAYPGG